MPNTMTLRFVRGQISAMKVPVFEVGVFKPAQAGAGKREPEMLIRKWDSDSLLNSIGWLRLQNLNGRHIYIRPKGEHPLSLLDDLKFEAIEQMKSEGFHPAVVVETSPGNFQAWVNHGEVLSKELSTRASQTLSQKFGADPSSADWRHFGRMAGFTNRKEKHRREDGLPPFVKLIEARGEVYPQAKVFVAQIRQDFDVAQRSPHRQEPGNPPGYLRDLRTIADFNRRLDYHGDGHRIDMAYSIYALSHGMSENEVRACLRNRELSHKGNQKRQDDYIERTIRKAWTAIRGGSRER